jgi:pimeloyl-ACP methyl ester carboxylesterase
MSKHFFLVRSLGMAFLFGLTLIGCAPQSTTEKSASVQNGKLIKSEKIAEFDTAKLSKILNEEMEQFLTGSKKPFAELKGKYHTPINGVTLYKLTYQTSIPEKDNKPAEVTGLVAIPTSFAAGTPMVSYQHGTVFGKGEVPSNIEESMETKLMLGQFGGQGYIVIAADYVGLGSDSTNGNSYFSRKSTEQACLDMYKAAQEFLGQQKIQVGNFFTMGWSQGGYNTLTFLRRLEQEKIPVAATLTAAAPPDLLYFIGHGILNRRPIDAPWIPAALSNLLFSYENYGGLTGLPERAIRSEYLQTAKDFYAFKIGFMDFFQKTPQVAADFLKPEFVDAFRLGSDPLCSALNSAEGFRWRSDVPLRSFYGESDEAVPVDLAMFLVQYQTALGKKNGELVNAGANADHRATYAVALTEAKNWFDGFIKK